MEDEEFSFDDDLDTNSDPYDSDTPSLWDDEDSDASDSFDFKPPPKNLVGHKEAISFLESVVASGRMPHALLFSGTQGIGKCKVAKSLARMLLTGSPTMDVSENHPITTQMEAGSCADYLYISGENRGDESREKAVLIDIEQIRAIDQFLSLTRASCPMRVIIIDGAETMNANAANALLKNLEEPPPHTVIILISHNAARLLPTIRSRCRMMAFKPLCAAECQQILTMHDANASEADLALLVALADASPGLALKWLNLNGISMYESLCQLFSSKSEETTQITEIMQFAAEVVADKAIIHQKFQMLSGLLLAFFSRMHHPAPLAASEAEIAAMQRWKSTNLPEQWTECWFEIKEQCAIAQGLHLDTKNMLTTLLLRLVRGKMPLTLKAS